MILNRTLKFFGVLYGSRTIFEKKTLQTLIIDSFMTRKLEETKWHDHIIIKMNKSTRGIS